MAGLLALFILLTFRGAFADGTCGTNVKYTIDGNTMLFSKGYGTEAPFWGADCSAVFKDNAEITYVKVTEKISLADGFDMFRTLKHVREMDLSKLDVSAVTNMEHMFYECNSLESLDLSSWDTSNVTSMHYMFAHCSSLKSLDLSGWDTSSVRDMFYMFAHCSSLESLDLNSWDTSSVETMEGMFISCGLQRLDVSGWDTSSVTKMQYMFYSCWALKSLDLSGWDTSSVEYMNSMFQECLSLVSLNVSGWDTSKVTTMERMFFKCISLRSLDLSSWDTFKMTNTDETFESCDSLKTLVLGKDTGWKNIFESLPAYEENWIYYKWGEWADTPLPLLTVKTGSELFGDYNLIEMAGVWSVHQKLVLAESLTIMNPDGEDITGQTVTVSSRKVQLTASASPQGAAQKFFWHSEDPVKASVDSDGKVTIKKGGKVKITAAAADGSGVSAWIALNTPGTCGTNVKYTIAGNMISFAKGDGTEAPKWEDGTGSNCGAVFKDDPEITSVKVTEKISLAAGNGMFTDFSHVREMDLSNLDVSAVTNMEYMFDGCSSLESLDLSGWDTSNVTTMGGMFTECSSLTSLDLSGWDTSAVENMLFMFDGCSSLKTLALGKNTVNKNIFETLPAYNGPWYYLKKGAAAGNPLPLQTSKAGSELFGTYDSSQMAGVWSTDQNLVLADSIRIEYPAGEEITGQTITVDSRKVQLTASASPAGAGQKFFWHSVDTETAVVDADGKVTFKKGGEVTITVKAADGSGVSAWTALRFSASCGTNVKYTIDGNTISFAKGDSTEAPKWEDGAGSNCGAVFKDDEEITSVKVTEKISVTKGLEMFKEFAHVREMDLSKLDVSAVTDMKHMFFKCSALESLHVSGWDTSNVTTMVSMFYGCGSLESLDLSGWDTSEVTDMADMFYRCYDLSSLDVSGWVTSKVADMGSMFNECTSLSSLDVSGWVTSSVKFMHYMFGECGSLTSLDVSGWDTSHVDLMNEMFRGCSSLKTLALGIDTVNKNIFDTDLPAYENNWIYYKQGAAGNPLPLQTVKTGSELFGAYDSSQMAGVWSTDQKLVLAEDIRIEYPAGKEITGRTITVDRRKVRLTASASPDGAGQKFFWQSEDPETAVVDADGKVTFKKVGEVTITVKAADAGGVSAETTLIYVPHVEAVTILDPDGADITGNKVTVDTKEYQLSAAAEPAEALQEFGWTVSDGNIASVDTDGKVTFLKAGTVTVTAAASDGSGMSAQVTLYLKPEEDPAQITAEAEVIRGGNTIDLDDCVASAIGKVSFSIKGEDLGCSLDPESHVLASGEKTGTVTVAVSVADSDFHYGKTGTITVSVIEKKQETLNVEQEGAVFGGTLPAPKYTAPEDTLSQTVVYSGDGYGPSEEPPAEAGSYEVTVRCETKDTVYTGTVKFTISRKPLTDPSVTAELLPADTFTWTGETFEITGAEVRDGEKLLTEGTDYELGGELQAADPGTYEVIISAGEDAGESAAKALSGSNYTGELRLPWEILTPEPTEEPTAEPTEEPTPDPTPEPVHGPDRSMNFFRLCKDCVLPETGFSAGHPTALSEQPKALQYEPLRLRIMIPALDVDTELVQVPLTGNSWPVEWLGERAGLLEGSALPGQGISVVAAHNTLNTAEYGPFALLGTLAENDLILTAGMDGSVKLFRVYANALLEADDAEQLNAIAGREADSLVLLTCENESAEGGYLNRRVVFAKLISR